LSARPGIRKKIPADEYGDGEEGRDANFPKPFPGKNMPMSAMAQSFFRLLASAGKGMHCGHGCFSLERALKIGVSPLRRRHTHRRDLFSLFPACDKEANGLSPFIAQLEVALTAQEQLMADARSARADLQQSDVHQQKQQLKQQSDELRQKISAPGPATCPALRRSLRRRPPDSNAWKPSRNPQKK